MKLIILPEQTLAQDRFNRKLVLTYADLATWTSATGQAVVPINALGVATTTNPTNVIVERFVINVVTAFTSSGGAITTLTLSIGDGGSAARFLSAIDLKTTGQAQGAALTNGHYLYTAADTLDAVATIAGQTMASLNAGQVEIAFAMQPTAGVWTVGQPG